MLAALGAGTKADRDDSGLFDPVGNASLADIAFTLQTGRESMEERLAMVTDSRQDLAEKLSAFVNGDPLQPGMFTGRFRPWDPAREKAPPPDSP